jgi:hypothetical protein
MASTDALILARRRLVAAPALCLASLLGWALLVAAADIRATLALGGPLYTVAEVQAHLAHGPRYWVGRTLFVRGEIVPCLAMPSAANHLCAALAPRGWQPPSPSPWRAANDPLPVVRAGLDPFLAPVRRLPPLGDLLPAPQVLQWGAVATYRVHVRTIPNSLCGASVCYEALLLDAAPDSQ